MLTVYFDTGKSAVSKDMAAAAGTLKAYLDSHPGSKLAVSGYNDPSGNAAMNAALSKKRAQAVAAALKSAGIPEAVRRVGEAFRRDHDDGHSANRLAELKSPFSRKRWVSQGGARDTLSLNERPIARAPKA